MRIYQNSRDVHQFIYTVEIGERVATSLQPSPNKYYFFDRKMVFQASIFQQPIPSDFLFGMS